MLTIAITFVVSFAAMFGVYWAIALRPDAAEHEVLRKRMAGAATAAAAARKAPLIKAGERLSAIPTVDRLLRARTRLAVPMQRQLALAGMKMTPAALFLACGCTAVSQPSVSGRSVPAPAKTSSPSGGTSHRRS